MPESFIPCIAVVGRPNVGKSTLFNRLLGRRKALVHDTAGVTRDRVEANADWWIGAKKYSVKLIDTGGLGEGIFSDEIEKQVRIALAEATLVIAVLDVRAGLVSEDQAVIDTLRKFGVFQKVPVVGVLNKAETEALQVPGSEFYSLGLDELHCTSAEHNVGVETLKEALLPRLFSGIESGTHSLASEAFPKIAIVGRPNVGKSTLINALLGSDRMITSPRAGTTVDPIDIEMELNGKPYVLVDTAGVRRKNKTERGVEILSVMQTINTLDRADLAVLVLDGEEGITEQDEKVGGLIEEAGCSVVLVVNKWDTQKKNVDFTRDEAATRIRDAMGFLKYAPIVFMSALYGKGVKDLGPIFEDVLHQRDFEIPTHELTEWMRREVDIHNPMNAKFYFCHQSGRHPPTIVCHVNDPKKIHFSLKRHLINAARERWGFMGTPIRLILQQRAKSNR